MSLPLEILLVVAASVLANRVVAMCAGLWLRIPEPALLTSLIGMDLVQIPFFYWIYSHSTYVLGRLPERFRKWFQKDWTSGRMGRWAGSLGGPGVMSVAFLPALGGGMWSAVFLAYSLKLPKRASVLWISLGTIGSFVFLFWILKPLVETLRYFVA